MRIEQEKIVLDERLRALAKVCCRSLLALLAFQALLPRHLCLQSLKDASAKTNEMERKRMGMTRNEEKLTYQIVQLKKENEDLKARKFQANAQIKQLQNKLATVEAVCDEITADLTNAKEEVEHARKSCREYQFRIRQLQEEVVFLEKRKRNGYVCGSGAVAAPAMVPAMPAAQTNEAQNDDVPSWMKD